MKRKTLGILREGYSKWERRSPLTPFQVSKAIREQGLRVIVQPSTQRVFSNAEYEQVGAEINENLQECDCLIGVKQVEISSLIPNKTYLFFSHTIKAQESNMKLLDAIFEKKVRLIDHELIRNIESGERLVAFGDYAGRAGMIEAIRGLGLRLLGLGYSTPFLNVGPAYSYTCLDKAVEAISTAFDDYARYGGANAFLPKGFGPMLFSITGGGKVSRGAKEVFQAVSNTQILTSIKDIETKRTDPNKIYGIWIRDADIMKNIEDNSAKFDRQDYLANPHKYTAEDFATKVLQYSNLVLTGAYWDIRYPRWMPNTQLIRDNSKKLLMVADVSCDINGTFEGLTRSTTIEEPFYYVDFENGMKEVTKCTSKQEKNPNLKLVLGVDILPSELPREASAHFGNCLLPFLPQLCNENVGEILERAVIAENGKLKKNYEYIDLMRKQRERGVSKTEEQAFSDVIQLEGHLFDTRLINRVLDLIENNQAKFQILQASLSQPRGGPGRRDRAHTTVLLKIGGESNLNELILKIERLVKEAPIEAEASIMKLSKDEVSSIFEGLQKAAKSPKEAASWTPTSQNIGKSNTEEILILGSGLVAGPAIEYLLKYSEMNVKVVSAISQELEHFQRKFSNSNLTVHFQNLKDEESIEKLINPGVTKCVLSLLPATMHPLVAKACLKQKSPLVTASYVGNLTILDSAFREAGIPILCEMGLDPGMDHMSCAKLIELGGGGSEVISFESYCGGLPSPECSNNPLGYKLSWSPRGVLTALKNKSKFILNGKMCESDNILLDSKPFELSAFNYPSLNLEMLPNRDATIYAKPYGVELSSKTQNFLRGTLRFRGFCEVLLDFERNGWLNEDPKPSLKGKQWSDVVHSSKYSPRSWEYIKPNLERKITADTPLDALCELFKATLSMKENERDLVIMEHRLRFANGTRATSTLVEFGTNEHTAMAKTVGVTAAIGVRLVIEKKYPSGGIHLPVDPWIYNEALKRLEEVGIHFHDSFQ